MFKLTLGSKIGLELFENISINFFRCLNHGLETWNWKSIKNTWSIEAKILIKKFEIEASFKVRFLPRNDEMTRIGNFKAFTDLVIFLQKLSFEHSVA